MQECSSSLCEPSKENQWALWSTFIKKNMTNEGREHHNVYIKSEASATCFAFHIPMSTSCRCITRSVTCCPILFKKNWNLKRTKKSKHILASFQLLVFQVGTCNPTFKTLCVFHIFLKQKHLVLIGFPWLQRFSPGVPSVEVKVSWPGMMMALALWCKWPLPIGQATWNHGARSGSISCSASLFTLGFIFADVVYSKECQINLADEHWGWMCFPKKWWATE